MTTPRVALESSVLAQGLAVPHNRVAAERMTSAVRSAGAEPAITAVVRGVPTVSLGGDDLERFLQRDGVVKVSSRDLAWCMTTGRDGATTVAATMVLAARAGIEVFATGGIGGVHRDAPFDESADLVELARTPTIVICAGAKSILDLPATLERLETLGVPVLGYRTRELPGFFTMTTGLPLTATAESVHEIATAWRHHQALGLRSGMLVVQCPPKEYALPWDVVEAATQAAVASAVRAGVHGSGLTPFLLAELEQRTQGQSVRTNLALLEANAALAGELSAVLTERVLGPSVE